MAVAAKSDFRDNPQRTLTVATKFSNITRNFYASKGRDVDIIHLNGSIEIAPILGLSDVIVDIVETGSTLRENGLVLLDEICDLSARVIVNRVSMKMEHERIMSIIDNMRKIIKEESK